MSRYGYVIDFAIVYPSKLIIQYIDNHKWARNLQIICARWLNLACFLAGSDTFFQEQYLFSSDFRFLELIISV